MRRDQTIRVRVSAGELEQIRDRIAEGETLSSHLRRVALGQPKPRRSRIHQCPDLRDLIMQIARIGNNLNQIARHVNRSSSVDAIRLLSELQAIEQALDEIKNNSFSYRPLSKQSDRE